MNASSIRRRNTEQGLTLVEVLVALVIVSIAGLALARVSMESLHHAVQLENRTLATLVADNQLVSDILNTKVSRPGSASGEVELGGRNWQWTRKVGTDLEGILLRIEIEVTGPDDTGQIAVWRMGWRKQAKS